MANYGYHRVSQETLIAFLNTLTKTSPWADINIALYGVAKDQLAIPILELLKLRLLKKLNNLVSATSLDTGALSRLDLRWDTSQRRLNRRIEDGEDDPDPKVEAASGRLRAALLLGNGLAQTQLSYEDEVKHGQNQLLLLRAKRQEGSLTPSLAEDAALLELSKIEAEIEQTTNDLENELRQVPKEAASTSRYARVKLAVNDCVETLNHMHRELEEQIEATQDAQTKARLQSLLDALSSLIPQRPPKKEEPKPTEAK